MSLNDQHANEFEEMPASSCDPESPLIEVSDCGCGSKQSKLPGTVSSAISPAPVQLVYALGTLGFDFGSEARRDSIVQHMNAQDGGQSPYDANHLLKYLDKNPWDAQSIYWVLTLDTTPIYVIQPRGAFAAAGYERLRQFLREQVADAIERVSIPGVIIGRAKLMSGQVLPVVWPDLRGMSNWNTSALVSATVSNDQTGSGSERQDDIASFLERIYHGLRNLGLSSQDRAINFAATNALNAARVFETALKDRMHLDTIEVERSPICRPESDCWDVKLTFFDPEHQTQRARHVYRFTVDVSDICPVMVGGVRSWSIR